jgi:hypothetical protein
MHGGIGLSHPSPANLLTTNGNDVFLGPIAAPAGAFGRLAGVNQATLANWQAATGQEGLGQTVDPAATTGSKWSSASAVDLHFDNPGVVPGGLNGGVATATTGVSVDIDGQTRNASAPLPGADEVIAGAGVTDWSMF